MKICDFTKPELDWLMAECNFTKDETECFLLKASGISTEDTAERMNVSVSTAKRILRRIWSKIDRVKNL